MEFRIPVWEIRLDCLSRGLSVENLADASEHSLMGHAVSFGSKPVVFLPARRIIGSVTGCNAGHHLRSDLKPLDGERVVGVVLVKMMSFVQIALGIGFPE